MFDNGFDFEALNNEDGVVTAFTKGYGRRAKKMRENYAREKDDNGKVLGKIVVASAVIAAIALIGDAF
jgi:hypothetical protein